MTLIPFQERLRREGLNLSRLPLEVLQINVGKLCDIACLHCHVEAGPNRREVMERKTAERLMELLSRTQGVHTVDLTGGAPELTPHFRYLVQEASKILTSRKAALRGRSGSLGPAKPDPRLSQGRSSSPLKPHRKESDRALPGRFRSRGGSGEEVRKAAPPIEAATQAPIIDRCNLTVFFEKGQEETPYFLKEHRVRIIASLPCYTKENVDRQRGKGVFDKSIRGLKLLNGLGYGRKGTGLELDLVYNPLGAFLPPSQIELEADYKRELKELFGIEFNRLFAITNMPIKRFLHQLEREGKWAEYMSLLAKSFNPAAAAGVMCRNLISIGWDGQIYDCDFNQMLEMPIGGKQRTIWEVESFDELASETISFDNHCYGCTAGAGSSCAGALTL